jgi:hypothetical protein
MTKKSGLGHYLLVDGYDLSGDIGSLGNIGGGPAALEVTGIDKSAPERLGGLRDGRIEFDAWFNDAAAHAHPVLSALPATDRQLMYLCGQAIGSAAANVIAKQVNYDPTRAADGAFTIGVSAQGNGYALEWGEQITPGVRTDTSATNGASFDNGAASSFGAQIYLQVESVTGTSVTVKIQDSADNSSWADLTGGAFTAATGRGVQRIATANNATVRRYLRVATSGTFSSAVFAVVLVRNEVAGVVF